MCVAYMCVHGVCVWGVNVCMVSVCWSDIHVGSCGVHGVCVCVVDCVHGTCACVWRTRMCMVCGTLICVHACVAYTHIYVAYRYVCA